MIKQEVSSLSGPAHSNVQKIFLKLDQCFQNSMATYIKKGGHGGYRPGAGRRPYSSCLTNNPELNTDDEHAFFVGIMRDESISITDPMAAAREVSRLRLRDQSRVGKRQALQDAAEEVIAEGKFAPGKPPRLQIIK